MHPLPKHAMRACVTFSLIIPVCSLAATTDDTRPVETILVEGEQIKSGLEKEKDLTPGGVTVIDSAGLYERNISTLADMLRYTPGMWVADGSTGDSTFFSSRGSNLDATSYDGNGIKLLQDGLPITAADGNNHNRDVDPLATRYAVVARGANALTYGASTLGGAMNFTTPTARDTESRIVLNGGSHGQRQGRIMAGTVSGRFDGMITLETRNWDGFREMQHEQQRESLYANAGWQFNNSARTRFYLTAINNDQGLPGGLTAAQFESNPYQASQSNVTGNFQFNVETLRLANKTTFDINENSNLAIGLSHEEQALYHPIVYSPFFSLLIDTDQETSGISLRYNRTMDNHDLLFGINYAETTVKGGNYSHTAGVRETLNTIVDNSADNLELFLVDRWQLSDNWRLVYGAQLVSAGREIRNTSTSSGNLYNPEEDYSSINPRLGIIYQLSDGVELFANASRLYEPPTNYELEDDASGDGNALNAMHGEVIEVGTRGSRMLTQDNSWYWEMSLYYGQLRDEILSVEDPNAPGTSLSANVDDTVHAGFEATTGASFALDNSGIHRFEPVVSLTLNEFSFDNDSNYGNNDLPVAPGYALKGELMYRNINGYYLGATYDLVDDRYADFSNTYTVDSYTLLGLRTGFSGRNWDVYVDFRNLTDKEYVSVFSVRNQAAPDAPILQPGEPRSVYVGTTIRF